MRVYAKGSSQNNTNVRRDSDVDVAVEWSEDAYVGTIGATKDLTSAQLGYTPVKSAMTPGGFRSIVEAALMAEFGAGLVDVTGDKAINIDPTTTTLDADVVPCFELHRYDAPGMYHVGHRLFPRSGALWIDNFPQQHYDNGVAKNNRTGGRYKDMVRGIKRLESELLASGAISSALPGYVVECLVFNVPDDRFNHNRLVEDLEAVYLYLWSGLKDAAIYREWAEVHDLHYLFRGGRHSPDAAFQFIDKAWDALLEQ
ncbi:MAG: hypothetical protein EPO65_04070 [Dehalococcoidia bacterium]|nr:MAG: hypothetical protein EPO65_04070 [Dehalococcoidia bacterium]